MRTVKLKQHSVFTASISCVTISDFQLQNSVKIHFMTIRNILLDPGGNYSAYLVSI